MTTEPSQQWKTDGSRHTRPHFSCCETYKLILGDVCNERGPFLHEGIMPELLVRIDCAFRVFLSIFRVSSTEWFAHLYEILFRWHLHVFDVSLSTLPVLQHFRHTTSLFPTWPVQVFYLSTAGQRSLALAGMDDCLIGPSFRSPLVVPCITCNYGMRHGFATFSPTSEFPFRFQTQLACNGYLLLIARLHAPSSPNHSSLCARSTCRSFVLGNLSNRRP